MEECVLCGEAVGEETESTPVIDRFVRDLLRGGEDEEYGEMCEDCGALVEQALEVGRERKEVEEKVLMLQRQLLQEMKGLQNLVEGYSRLVQGIEERMLQEVDTLRRGDGSRKTRGSVDKGCRLRRKITEAIIDLKLFEEELISKTNVGVELEVKHENDEAYADELQESDDELGQDDPPDCLVTLMIDSGSSFEEGNVATTVIKKLKNHFFKGHIIRQCLRRRALYLKKAGDCPNSPVNLDARYLFHYNQSSKVLSVAGTPITILEDCLGCSLCEFQTPLQPLINLKGKLLGKTMDAIHNHILGVHFPESMTCPICAKKFRRLKKYREHILEHERGVQCPICGKPLSRSDFLPRHKWTHMNEQEKEEYLQKRGANAPFYVRQKLESPKEESHPCTLCGKTFASPQYLRVHEKRHAQDRMVCPRCGKSMTRISYRNYHSKFSCPPLAGSGGGPEESLRKWSCLQCPDKFVSPAGLRVHVQRKHSKAAVERSHKCPECGKGFKRPADVKTHAKTHQTEQMWSCPGCGKTFNVKRNLDRHKCRLIT